MQKKIKTFWEDKYFNFEELIFSEEKHFEKTFAQYGVSLAKLKIDFLKSFVKASQPENLEKSGF